MSTLSNREIDALDRADEVLERAFDAASPREAVRTALLALEASPLCADAYVVLAQNGRYDGHEALHLWRTGLAAAEVCLKDSFKRYKGEFWGFIETRPYMRAKHGLAMALITLGQRREAIVHLAEMLELNPNDNQGARYVLLECYMADRKDKAAWQLMGQYPDEASAWFAWSAALLTFRQSGAGTESAAALATALESNQHVPAFLTGKRKMPKQLPDAYQHGEADEAQLYARGAALAWAVTEGAINWLKESMKQIDR
jgi:hypothetical protein